MADNYLVITDGTTTVTMLDGSGGNTNYQVASGRWSPKITRLRESTIGARGPYEDVEEEITLHITDTTAAGCYTRIDTLTRLIEQAKRWYRGESVSAVLVKYSPAGATVSSSGTPLQAAILDGSVMLSPDIEFARNVPYIRNVVLRFTRRGLWLLSEANASSASTNNGSLASITLAATTNTSPVRFWATLVGVGNVTGYAYRGGFVAISDLANTIDINAAADAATGAYTAVDDTAKNSRTSFTLRYTPAVITEVSSANIDPQLASTTRLVGVFANIRNNSTSTSFTLRMKFTTGTISYTPYYYIAPQATAYPYWRFIGVAYVTGDPSSCNILVTASAASGTVDIDTIVLVDFGNPTTHVIGLNETTNLGSAAATLDVNHNLLTSPTPSLDVSDFVNSYTGDLVIHNKGGTIYCLLMATGYQATGAGDYWRQTSSVPAVLQNAWTAWRYTGYLTPR